MTGLEARTGSSLMDCDAAIVVQLKVCSLGHDAAGRNAGGAELRDGFRVLAPAEIYGRSISQSSY
jgi:hypothetical protein